MSLNFITLYARDIQETATCYRILGLDFVEEQHGKGPRHLATRTAGLTLEIYPCETTIVDGFLLGFEVEDLRECRDRLAAAGVKITSEIAERHGFWRFIAQDADWRRVLVSQA
jgi:lactoylglutathione lyase